MFTGIKYNTFKKIISSPKVEITKVHFGNYFADQLPNIQFNIFNDPNKLTAGMGDKQVVMRDFISDLRNVLPTGERFSHFYVFCEKNKKYTLEIFDSYEEFLSLEQKYTKIIIPLIIKPNTVTNVSFLELQMKTNYFNYYIIRQLKCNNFDNIIWTNSVLNSQTSLGQRFLEGNDDSFYTLEVKYTTQKHHPWNETTVEFENNLKKFYSKTQNFLSPYIADIVNFKDDKKLYIKTKSMSLADFKKMIEKLINILKLCNFKQSEYKIRASYIPSRDLKKISGKPLIIKQKEVFLANIEEYTQGYTENLYFYQ